MKPDKPYYQDLREFIRVLEENGKLLRIKREINKDSELHPLVRWQFRGLEEEDRKAFLFENVTDSKKRAYRGSVLVGGLAGSALVTTCRAPQPLMEQVIPLPDTLSPAPPRLR